MNDSAWQSARPSKVVLKALMTVSVALASSVAVAGTTTAAIQSIRLNSSTNLVYVFPAGGVQGAPSCQAATTSSYYSFSMARSMAKEYLAALLSAHARGTPVTLSGTGACQDEATSETLDSVSLN
jgi:hypothetical protein